MKLVFAFAIIHTMLVGHVETVEDKDFDSLAECKLWKYQTDMTFKGYNVIWQEIECKEVTVTLEEE